MKVKRVNVKKRGDGRREETEEQKDKPEEGNVYFACRKLVYYFCVCSGARYLSVANENNITDTQTRIARATTQNVFSVSAAV